ncbi:hypothetical protein E2C01_100413 [Portunus trituberculatus]|uniref:Uncharacterized protein n=1 Tax=Portunus trituberculatus TaxID=210409 RepID=A0A5B7KHX0_PORTR|nr:hypothetical protein [Portunus trituberculatus]
MVRGVMRGDAGWQRGRSVGRCGGREDNGEVDPCDTSTLHYPLPSSLSPSPLPTPSTITTTTTTTTTRHSSLGVLILSYCLSRPKSKTSFPLSHLGDLLPHRSSGAA